MAKTLKNKMKLRRMLKKRSGKRQRLSKKRYTRKMMKGGAEKTITIKYAQVEHTSDFIKNDTSPVYTTVELKQIDNKDIIKYNVFEIKTKKSAYGLGFLKKTGENMSNLINQDKYTKITDSKMGIFTNYPYYIPLYTQNYSQDTNTNLPIPLSHHYATAPILNCNKKEINTLSETDLINTYIYAGNICPTVYSFIQNSYDVCAVSNTNIPTC